MFEFLWRKPVGVSAEGNQAVMKASSGDGWDIGEVILCVIGGGAALSSLLIGIGSTEGMAPVSSPTFTESLAETGAGIGDMCEVASHECALDPVGATTILPPLGSTTALGPTALSGVTGSPAEELPIIFLPVDKSDLVSYSKVEKRAQSVYHALHKNQPEEADDAIVIAANEADYTLFKQSFKNTRKDAVLEQVSCWTELLENLPS